MNSYPQAQDGGNKFVEGLAAGGLLAGLGYFSLNPKRRAEARQKIANMINPDAKSATAGVRQVSLQDKANLETAAAGVPTPAAPTGPTAAERKAVYEAVAQKPEAELPQVTRPQSGVDVELITDPVTGEKFAPGRSPAGVTPRSYLEDQGFVDNTMVDQQDARVGLQVDQSVAAINAAEDQATGRVMRRLQANEDLDMGAVNAAKEQAEAVLEDTISRNPELASATPLDAAANSVARSLPDGAPIDQAETGARMQGPITAQELVDQAKQEMIDMRLRVTEDLVKSTGQEPSPSQVERALARRLQTQQQGDPGRTMTGSGLQRVALPEGAASQTVTSVGASETLPERAVVNIGPQAAVTKTAAGTAIRGASPVMDVAQPVERTRPVFGSSEPLVPGAPDERMPDRPGSESAFQQIQSAPVGRIDDYAENVDRGVTAGGIGVYGREPKFVPGAMSKATGEYSAASQRKPTDLPFKEAPSGGAKFSDLSSDQLKSFIERAPEGRVKQAGLDEARRRENTGASLQSSEALRRAEIEGGQEKAQSLLKQKMAELGISAIGEFSPYPRR
jgi:hypothetical protein